MKSKEKINILLPVFNEEKILETNILKLKEFLDKNLSVHYKIFIVDGKSTDKTSEIGKMLEKKHENIAYINTDIKGKGGQLKKAILELKGEYFTFIDIDFPMTMDEILEVLNSLIERKADLIVGSRNTGKKRVDRPVMRKAASKAYNFIAKVLLGLPTTDIQCGIKAWNSNILEVWSKVKDEKWFFDTQLLYHAMKAGNKISEVPVTYCDMRKESKILPLKDGIYFAKELFKLKFGINS